jgi:hypothetical protein
MDLFIASLAVKGDYRMSHQDKGIKSHSIRSGLNFWCSLLLLILTYLGAIDMGQFIKSQKMKARIFALVHDSISSRGTRRRD